MIYCRGAIACQLFRADVDFVFLFNFKDKCYGPVFLSFLIEVADAFKYFVPPHTSYFDFSINEFAVFNMKRVFSKNRVGSIFGF